MEQNPGIPDALRQENEQLRLQNARLRQALDEVRARLTEPEEIIRAIRQGEIDALVVEEQGDEQIYSLQTYDSVYRAMVEQYFPFGVWMAAEDGSLLYVTPTFLDLLGSHRRPPRELGPFSFLPDGPRAEVEREWTRSLQTGLPCSVEYTIDLPDGSLRHIWTQGVLARSDDGRRLWVGVNIDITERNRIREELKQQAEALREADRRKDEFLALLGHELRNPLATINSCLHILLMPSLKPENAERVRQMLLNQMHHLSRMVDDLLDVNRITRGIIHLRKVRVDLVEAVNHAIESVAPLIESREHRLTLALPAGPVHVEADPTRIEQVLVNLLNNAAKYTSPGGQIHLAVERDGEEVAIRVEDNGVGIAAEILPSIFDLFVQAGCSLDRSQGGLGIGLTLVRKLVEMHGGRIEAHSEGAGRGSRFIVRLPVLSEVPVPDVEEPTAYSTDRRQKVLVVDDSPDLTLSLKLLLELTGHEVVVAHNGPTALEMVAAHEPEVVLLDIGLPGMSGYEVASRLCRRPGDHRPLVVAMSGYGQEEDKRRARAAGFDVHITKPVDPHELLSLIASAPSVSGA